MAKTELTIQLEREIWKATSKQGVFGCYEVTIGWFGKERVDYLTYDTKGIFRCYEIKVSKADFHSRAHNTFVGHYNYYVMPKELYEQVKEEIPKHVGVYVDKVCVKNAKKQEPTIDIQILKDSMIRSLCRECEKQMRDRQPTTIELYNRRINKLEKDVKKYRDMYYNSLHDKIPAEEMVW